MAPVPVVSGFLAAVGLAPSLTSTTTPAPAPAAFVWAVLAFVRREIEQAQQAYFNRTPRAVDDIVTEEIDEDAGATDIDVLGNDIDRDLGDVKTVTAVTNGSYGTVAVSADGTSVTYTPDARADVLAAGETVEDTFTYTVSDASSPSHLHGVFGFFSRGHTDTATVTVTLTGTNDAPTAVGGVANVNEDQVLTGTLPLGADVDGDALTYVLSSGARNGTVTITDSTAGTYTYTPNGNFNGTDSFTFVTNDGATNSVAATVTITVAAVNDPPVVQGSSTLSVRETETGRIPVSVTDPDAGDTYSITVTQGGKGAVAVDGNTVTYTPSAATQAALLAGQTVTDTYTYTVTDTGRAAVTTTVSVTITGEGSTGSLSTGEQAPVDLWLDGDRAIVRNEDGTLTDIEYSPDDGWTVDAGLDYGFRAGDLALDGGLVYAEVEADDFDDGTIAVVNLDTGEVERVTDGIGAAYQFGEVTDVAVDRRVETAEVVYAVDSSGTVYEIDSQTRQVVGSAETRSFEFRTDASVTADAAAVGASPKLAVAQGSKTVYVADGNRISVVQKRTVRTAQLVGEGEAAETEQLVHEADLDITLGAGDEITAIEVGADGTLYATVVSTNASASAVSGARLVRINVDAQSGRLLEGESVPLRGRDATSLSISDDLDRAYVVSAEDQTLSVVGLRRLDVLDVVQTGLATSVAVAPGTNTVLVANPGAHTISLVRETAVTTDAPITITLDWGSQPLDLDAHLVGATDDGTFHVSYIDRTWEVGSQIGASLDVDDRDGDGPERIALNSMSPGTYLFYVDNFSNDGGLIGSATNVTIQDQRTGRTLYTFDVPAKGADDTGTERYWSVFTVTIDGDGSATITPVTGDPLVDREPTLPDPPTPPPGSEIDL